MQQLREACARFELKRVGIPFYDPKADLSERAKSSPLTYPICFEIKETALYEGLMSTEEINSKFGYLWDLEKRGTARILGERVSPLRIVINAKQGYANRIILKLAQLGAQIDKVAEARGDPFVPDGTKYDMPTFHALFS